MRRKGLGISSSSSSMTSFSSPIFFLASCILKFTLPAVVDKEEEEEEEGGVGLGIELVVDDLTIWLLDRIAETCSLLAFFSRTGRASLPGLPEIIVFRQRDGLVELELVLFEILVDPSSPFKDGVDRSVGFEGVRGNSLEGDLRGDSCCCCCCCLFDGIVSCNGILLGELWVRVALSKAESESWKLLVRGIKLC